MATLTPLPLPLSFEDFCALFLLFIAYSTLGWCGEMIYCSVPKGRLCEKRGFLNGFLCPIYGHGALLVLYALRGGFRNPFLTFLFGALLTSALEYFTSWVMEKLFHMRWWDYSHYKFQINGRVCLLNSTCFGLACVLLCHVVHPWLWAHILGLGSAVIVPLASFISGIYLTDTVLSVRSAIQLSNRTEKLHQLQQEVRQHLAAAAESFGDKMAQGRERYLQSVDSMTRDFMEGSRTQQLMDNYDAYLAERQRQVQMLRSGQDMFERRLLRSHPNLRSRHDEQLNQLRRRLDRTKAEAKARGGKK